jgi:hypothetical protein
MYPFNHIFRVVLIFGIMFVGVSFGQGQNSECTSKIDDVFHSKIVYKSKTLYAVSKNHLLEQNFNKNCQVTEIRVAPRSYWIKENAEDNQDSTNDLTSKEYDRLLEKINKISPLGNFVTADSVGVSSNQRTWLWIKFDKAFINQSFYFVNDKGKKEKIIIGFSILYSNVVTGTITEKILFEENGNFSRAKILIDEDWYWTTGNLFSTAVLNENGQFQVFGNSIEPGQ